MEIGVYFIFHNFICKCKIVPETAQQTKHKTKCMPSIKSNTIKANLYCLLYLATVTLLGCNNQQQQVTQGTVNINDQLSSEAIFKRSYDIPILKNYKGPAKYLALFTITKRYNNTIAIEISEAANGINLCVKQPVVREINPQTYDSSRSLPFNQLCYWYADGEAASIKAYYKMYDTGATITDISCKTCLDPEIWTLEIYNHGRYSAVTKDAYGRYEPFIDSLFAKVRLHEKNGYSIKY